MSESIETKRVLDYFIGDIVSLTKHGETLVGPITNIRLSINKQSLIYVVLISTEKGIRFIQARSDQIHLIQYAEE